MSDDQPSDRDTNFTPGSRRGESQRERIPTDDIHHLLASERRRHLLRHLTKHPDDTATVDDLIDAIAERERPGGGPATHRERIATDLHHVHLPKLAEAGVIDYDPVAQTVDYNATPELESLLAASNALDVGEEEYR